MKRFLPLLIATVLTGQGGLFPPKSPHASVSQWVGPTGVSIAYNRPAVRNRAIWGALVPYGQVWRLGANDATTLTFDDAVKVEGHPVPKGTYALFAIPGPERWTFILNRRAKQPGAWEYDPALDILRFDVKPKPTTPTEWLTFEIYPASADGAYVDLYWEKLRVSFLVEVDVDGIVQGRMKRAMAANGHDWKLLCDAAEYCLERERQMAQAREWIDQSIRLQKNPHNLLVKARILDELGQTGPAVALLQEALEVGRKTKASRALMGPVEQTLAEWKARPGK
ncbi:MAG TPA: DUF2911 domain-containing protein [Holophagaceae bacterium]|nr:DUF2911 domain-containing protein [Holophagaceae bacterium]